MLLEIDHHGAALDRLGRHVLDAELVGVAEMAAAVAAGVGLRADHVDARLEAVVVERLGHAVAVGVEEAADMGERVPLRRILQRQDHAIVARHVDEQRVDGLGVEVEAPAVLVAGRRQHRRQAPRVQHIAARQVERQAEAERQAFLHLGDAFEHLRRRDEVQPAELIVVTPIAPGRAFGTVLPALHLQSPCMRGETSACSARHHARMAPARNSANAARRGSIIIRRHVRSCRSRVPRRPRHQPDRRRPRRQPLLPARLRHDAADRAPGGGLSASTDVGLLAGIFYGVSGICPDRGGLRRRSLRRAADPGRRAVHHRRGAGADIGGAFLRGLRRHRGDRRPRQLASSIPPTSRCSMPRSIRGRLGRAFSIHGVGGSLGWAAAPVMYFLDSMFGWAGAALIGAIPGLVLSVLVWGHRTDSGRSSRQGSRRRRSSTAARRCSPCSRSRRSCSASSISR